jgi:NAD(P)-dependent dehydrogenase (short-subunit alcohol dehydrogenase family)
VTTSDLQVRPHWSPGSGRNIGWVIVLELAGHGANVIVNTRSNADEAHAVAKEAEGLGVKSLVVVGEAAGFARTSSKSPTKTGTTT